MVSHLAFNLTMEKTILCILATTVAVLASPLMTRQELLNQQQHKAKFCSNLLHFNKFYYSAGETKAIDGFPADMSVHWKTGNVFYTLINNEMKMNLQILHPSGEAETIKVAGLGQSTTVDNLNDIVYLATDNGVYKYKEDGAIELYTALGEDVMYVTISNDGSVMYIATWPQNRVQKITNDGQKQETFSAIPNGHGLTIDPRNNIFFIATKTSYVLKYGQTIPIKIKELPSERMTGVFISRSDEVFAMDEDSNLYTIDAENASAKRL
ncbi:jg15744, partial [Pararge aegeria aegeria]